MDIDDALGILVGVIIVPLLTVAIFVMPFISFISWRRGLRLDREITALRQEVTILKIAAHSSPAGGAAQPVQELAVMIGEYSGLADSDIAQPSAPKDPLADDSITMSGAEELMLQAKTETHHINESYAAKLDHAAPKDLENRFGQRIYSWMGGISLALAGIFLAKYSIDQGWFSPTARIVLGVVFGFILLGFAEWMREKSNDLSQALAAASVSVLYANIFAANALYHLISPAFAFVILAGLTFVAVALALRHGTFVALVGFAGGFLTPWVVSTNEPNLPVLFAFLYLLQMGGLTLLHKRGWWYQAAIANAGGLLWAVAATEAFAADRTMEGTYAIALFFIATCWTAIWALESRGGAVRSVKMIWTTRGTSIACSVLMASLLTVDDFSLFFWVFALILTFSHLIAARLWSAEDVPAYLGTAIMIVTYACWPPTLLDVSSGVTIDRYNEIIIVGVIFGASLLFGGWYFTANARYPTRWAALSTLGSAFVFGGAYWQLHTYEFLLSWPVLAVGLAAIHMSLAQRLDYLRRQDNRYISAFALHCLAVSGFIAIAIPMQLENSWIPVAWSFELPVIAWVANRLGVAWLRQAIWIGIVLILGGIWFSDFPAGDTLIFNWLLYGLGLPMASFIITAYLLADTAEQKLRCVLQVLAAVLGFALIGLEVDHFFVHIDVPDPNFISHGVQAVFWLVGALILFPMGDRRQAPLLYTIGLAVAGVAGLWLLIFPLFWEHPLFNHLYVGETTFFNRISVIYGIPTLLGLGFAALLMKRPESEKKIRIGYQVAGIYSLILGFTTVSLLVRQFFHGAYIDFIFPSESSITDGELYGYSAAWTLYGFALLGLGLKLRSQPLRYASAIIVLLTVLKVGLVDASDLTGLYRVASFLGLGVALISIAYLYQRLLFKKKALVE